MKVSALLFFYYFLTHKEASISGGPVDNLCHFSLSLTTNTFTLAHMRLWSEKKTFGMGQPPKLTHKWHWQWQDSDVHRH